MRSTTALLVLTMIAAMIAAACEPEPSDDAVMLDDAGEPGDADDADDADDAGDPGDAGQPGGPTTPPSPTDLEGDVILRNRVALDMPVQLRPLAPDVELDCAAVEQDPSAHLPLASFAAGREVVLTPHEMVVVWPHEPGERPCYAVRVETEGLGARVLFWHDGEPPIQRYPASCCDVWQSVVELIPVDGGWSLDLLGNTWLVHPALD